MVDGDMFQKEATSYESATVAEVTAQKTIRLNIEGGITVAVVVES